VIYDWNCYGSTIVELFLEEHTVLYIIVPPPFDIFYIVEVPIVEAVKS
jgi:hypothetical protein